MIRAGLSESSRRLPRVRYFMLTVEDSGSTRIIAMAGELDMATVAGITAAIDRLDQDGVTLLVLDLQELDFLDLAGLRSILGADEYCRAHRIRHIVVKPRGFASRVFTLTGAHRELDLVDPVPR